MENEKKTHKTAGKVFMCITVFVTAVTAVLSAAAGGQKKLVEKYYAAVVHSDFDENFGAYFADGTDYTNSIGAIAEDYAAVSAGFDKTDPTNIIHARINFTRREIMSLTDSDYYFTVSYYDGGKYSVTTPELCFHMTRTGLGWKLTTAQPIKV